MSYITKFAEGFMHLFQTGAETFISWMTGIVPVVLMLMVAMNTLIAFLGEERVTKVAKLSAKSCYAIFSAAFFIRFYVRQSNVLYDGTIFTRIL